MEATEAFSKKTQIFGYAGDQRSTPNISLKFKNLCPLFHHKFDQWNHYVVELPNLVPSQEYLSSIRH